MKVICYSSFTFSYLNRARVLYRTLRRFHPDWELVALITDEPPEGFCFDPATEPFDRVVYAQDLGIPHFTAWMFKHDVVEACTAVKGPFIHQACSSGADVVIVHRLGPYAEIDFDQLIQFHLDHSGRVTAVTNQRNELIGTFVISSSRRNDAAFMLRHRMQEFRSPCLEYQFVGYLNELESAADLRRLAVDAFSGAAQITPEGNEVRPGVWVASGARVHRAARVLAPAYIGERARVRASAVVTRCSVLEHHAEVDCGTVVENATILPYATIGAGLDVAHSVVGFNRLAHLQRQVEIEITDPKLIGMASSAPLKALGSAAALASFMPVEFVRGLLGRKKLWPSAAQPAIGRKAQSSMSSEASADQFPLVVARRYGNE
jgi:tetrahydrodipicolinate N-succinyltransferase